MSSKGSIEAVLKSVGKTRAVVDKIGAVSRVAGPSAIVIEVTMTAVVIQQAAPRDRGRVAAREIGGLAGSIGGGLGGMWAGCAGASLLASPSLVIPVVGEVTLVVLAWSVECSPPRFRMARSQGWGAGRRRRVRHRQ